MLTPSETVFSQNFQWGLAAMELHATAYTKVEEALLRNSSFIPSLL